jgi:DUF4097 and DUF4098 domain-containing protein YvlB
MREMISIATSLLLTSGLLITGLAVSSGTFAGEDVDKILSASAGGYIKIVNTRGQVEIEGWDREEIHIKGELDDLAEELIFEVKGDRARVEVKLPRSNVNWGDGSDLTIRVPKNSKVDFDGVSTDTSIENISGGVRLRSVSGDIEAEKLSHQVHINTVSGNIDVTDSSGNAHISSVSGEINLQMRSSQIVLDTVSGEIEAEFDEIDTLRGNAVSGDIEVEGRLVADGEIEMVTVSGDLSLRLKSPVNARLSVDTGVGGDIENSLSDDEPEEIFPASNKLRAHLGDGSGRISLRTVTGDVRIDD